MGEEESEGEEGFALLTEQLEQLLELQKKANELAQSQVELISKSNELLKEIKVGVFFTPTPIRGVPTTAAPAAAPTKHRASLSETAERLKKEGEEQLPREEGK